MIVIADSNILISGLYNSTGTIVKILTSKSKIQFYAPSYLLEEINEHLTEVAVSVGRTKQQLLKELKFISSQILFVDEENISMQHYQEAIEIVKDIDIDDMPFVALHLHTGHKIWTGDLSLIKGLKKKGYDICITTSELKKSLYK